MRPNAERILDEKSNRKEEDKLQGELSSLNKSIGYQFDRSWRGDQGQFGGGDPHIEMSRLREKTANIKEKLDLLKDIDWEQALILNDEFDRLTENLKGKRGENLKNAQLELEEFKTRLNAKLKEK